MVRDDGQDLDLIKKIIGSYGDYYTDLPENKLLHAFEYLGKSWLLPYYKADFQWVITDEVKIINGYECRKAVTFHSPLTEKEKETVAWFAPQIPFQFGPMEYFGLPGLVLEIQKDFYVFYANEISFAEKDKKIPRPTLKKETEISRYKNEIKELEFKMKKVHVLQSQGG